MEQETERTIGDGEQICPLCQSSVRLFFINFNEKVLMCENFRCEYPFGHEELQFVREDMEIHPDEEVMSIKSKRSASPTGTSIISTNAWSEINRLNRAYETDDAFDLKSVDLKYFDKNETQAKSSPAENAIKYKVAKNNILKDVAEIKVLNDKMNAIEEVSETPAPIIKNEQWIKTLRALQEVSGCQLLKQQELDKMKQDQPDFGLGELKIDIDTNSRSGSSIKIEISKMSASSVQP